MERTNRCCLHFMQGWIPAIWAWNTGPKYPKTAPKLAQIIQLEQNSLKMTQNGTKMNQINPDHSQVGLGQKTGRQEGSITRRHSKKAPCCMGCATFPCCTMPFQHSAAAQLTRGLEACPRGQCLRFSLCLQGLGSHFRCKALKNVYQQGCLERTAPRVLCKWTPQVPSLASHTSPSSCAVCVCSFDEDPTSSNE